MNQDDQFTEFLSTESHNIANNNHPDVQDAGIFTYFTDEHGIRQRYSFNGVFSEQAISGFGQQLPPGWTESIKMLLEKSAKEDIPIIKNGNEVEYIQSFKLNGARYSFKVNKFPIAANPSILFATLRNITTAPCSAVVQSRDILFGLIADNMSDVFCVLDIEGNLLFLSPSVLELTGFKVAELLVMPIDLLLMDESRQRLFSVWSDYQSLAKTNLLTAENSIPVHSEVQFIRKDGKQCWAEVISAPYADEGGTIQGVHSMLRDITDRKSSQEAINSTLKHERELSEVKSKYISTVSHEFRTPLSIIYSNLQLLESHRFELDQQTINDAFELSRVAVKSLLRVLDKVTIIDATGKGKLEFKAGPTDIAAMCQKIVDDLREMQNHPERIVLRMHDLPDLVQADEYLLRNIISNLLHNALIFSGKKQEVVFEVYCDDKRLLHLKVDDSGIGIPEQDMAYIFEPFYRASNARNVKGSGLGLAVVFECVKLHSGKVNIRSLLGNGTHCEVEIPLEAQ